MTEENSGNYITPQQLQESLESLRTELSDSITGAASKAQKASLSRMEKLIQDQLAPLGKILDTLPTQQQEPKPESNAATETPDTQSADIPADNPLAQRLLAMTAQMEEQKRVIEQSQAQQQKLIELAEAQQAMATKERSQRLLTDANASFSGTVGESLYDPKVFIRTAKDYGLPIELDIQQIQTPEGTMEKAEWVYTEVDQYDQQKKTPLSAVLPELLKDQRFEYMAKGRSGGGSGTTPSQDQQTAPKQDQPAEVDLFTVAKSAGDPFAAILEAAASSTSQ